MPVFIVEIVLVDVVSKIKRKTKNRQKNTVAKEVGIKDVATAAGVSAGTVSNVINGHNRRVSAKTRDRVLRVIEELNYTPNLPRGSSSPDAAIRSD
ncbi:LacI family DNA-binding transcriptional regulator [Bauldia sp.]|uniref:LacI family DNA-binding transcriptional regulator n=1 Tax=Bauldia sp. TaxID=2575872 RepID=UPI003BABFADD